MRLSPKMSSPKIAIRQPKMNVALYISSGFLFLTAFLLFLIQFNELNALICYGKVAEGQTLQDASFLARLINALAKITVPKAWFAHFYVLYLLLMWAQLVFFPNIVLSSGKYLLVWFFCTFQATRRLYESYAVTQFSTTSKMHVSHYLLGLGYYIGVATTCFYGLQNQVASRKNDFLLVWTAVLLLVFLVVQADQYRNHNHLASLVKYSTPSQGFFAIASSAHYLDEILVYLIVTVLVFTRGDIIAEDWSFLCIWIFVVTNLTISALETHKYYKRKFDDFYVKYAIIPGAI